MDYNRISEETKRRIVTAFGDEEDYIEVARILGVKRTTAYGIVRRFQEHGAIVRPRGGARVAKVDNEMRNCMLQIVEENAAFTLNQIKERLQMRLPNKPHIHISTIAATLDGMLVRIKKLEDAPIDRNSPATKESRREYATWFMQNQGQNFIFVDECGFNLFMARTRGRARINQRAVRQVTSSRGKNLNLLMVVTPATGLYYYEIEEGIVNVARFHLFLQNLEAIPADFNVVVVMDSAPVHNDAQMGQDGHRIKKLPPYSPMLNPIENCFSCVKANVKRKLNERMREIQDRRAAAAAGVTLVQHRRRILRECVTSALEQDDAVTQQTVQNLFGRMMAYMPACLNLEDIIMWMWEFFHSLNAFFEWPLFLTHLDSYCHIWHR